ncbi:dermonecrotic toxin domain-containing protein [Pseudomonas sp. DG56-2]|uniref:dermonecrotic toxin domain-containing protein n=1 Tax=Pseudomonas sp. DG56-2 TaxID=2320270 RepID=UPI0010A66B96|nr:DUF6543 domain-containing protein [Pseudomonas sp. DG56-2]
MTSISQDLTKSSMFACQLTRTFSDRPALLDVAGQILVEQWQCRNISHHDPLKLYVSSKASFSRKQFVRPLRAVLLERYCKRTTLNLDDKQDLVIEDPQNEWGLEIDLHRLELLINDCGPLLIEIYKQHLVNYWNRADDSQQTPWQWYAQYLANQFQDAIDANAKVRALTPDTTHMASLVRLHTSPDAHERHADLAQPKVSLLTLDLSRGCKLDADLASAALIEPNADASEHTSCLLYTLTGQVIPFSSRYAVLEKITELWPQLSEWKPQYHLEPESEHVFEKQACGLIDQQLRVIDSLANTCRSQFDAAQLSLDVDRLTSMIELCNSSEQLHRQQLIKQLPQWLQNADSALLTRYGSMIAGVAQSYIEANGEFWLDGVDDAEHFANKKLNAYLLAEHPDSTLQPWDIEVVNYQVDAVAIPGQDSLVTEGSISPVHFSLAQLAIGNLNLLKPGQIELKTHSGNPLPEWMTIDYLRTVVSELDIGTLYPQMLRDKLLEDQYQRTQRQGLLAAQLATQIPALAMELHLNGNHLSIAAVDGICQIFQHSIRNSGIHWELRPLGFVSEPGAAPDQPYNTWLLEPAGATSGPCVLYRPLHAKPLQEFIDRLALLAAISTPGKLQEDILQRLPAERQSIYDHGGFQEPHLPFSVEDSFSVPFGAPAPVRLAVQTPLTDFIPELYLACVEESITHFKARSSTTSESHWARWKELGWLLFNSILPLAGPTLARATWLVQINIALIAYVKSTEKSDQPSRHVALSNLLFSLAVLLLSHAQQPLSLRSQKPQSDEIPTPPTVQPSPANFLDLDYSWSHPNQQLSEAQRLVLQQLQARQSPATMGMPMSSGAHRGLYDYNNQVWARLGDHIYRVQLDLQSGQPRIIAEDNSGTLGPWLQRDTQGNWQLDLGLRLRGGMPRNSRIAQRKAETEKRQEALRATYEAQLAHVPKHLQELEKLFSVVEKFKELTILKGATEKLYTLEAFWDERINTIKACNEVAPLVDYKSTLCFALFQKLFVQSALKEALIARITLRKEKIAEYYQLISDELRAATAAGTELVPGESWQHATQILDDITPQLDELVVVSEKLPLSREQLQQLDTRYKPEIRLLNQKADSLLTQSPEKVVFFAHLLRLENNYQKLILKPNLDPRSDMLLRRLWNNLHLLKSQRMRLYQLTNASEDLKARLLSDMDSILAGALRRLDNFAAEPGDANQQKIIEAIRKDLAFATRNIKSALTDYPPTLTIEQLQRQTPGLIETHDQGLLLGKLRPGNDELVDIFDADDVQPIATYRKGQNSWEELTETPAPLTPSAPSQQSLSQLIKKSTSLIQDSNKDLKFFESRAAMDYLPADIEDMLAQQRQRVEALRDTLRRRLSDAPGTSDGKAQEAMATLDNQARILKEQARTLRINAALRQAPRMGELQYLIEHNEVEIKLTGARKLLPKVKGRLDDYFDEYEIRHNGRPIWFAHFHYLGHATPKLDFVAGHLKTVAQRYLRGRTAVDPLTGQTTEVHRAPISTIAAKRYFFAV